MGFPFVHSTPCLWPWAPETSAGAVVHSTTRVPHGSTNESVSSTRFLYMKTNRKRKEPSTFLSYPAALPSPEPEAWNATGTRLIPNTLGRDDLVSLVWHSGCDKSCKHCKHYVLQFLQLLHSTVTLQICLVAHTVPRNPAQIPCTSQYFAPRVAGPVKAAQDSRA